MAHFKKINQTIFLKKVSQAQSPSRKRRKERPVGPWKSGFGVWKRQVGLFWGLGFEKIFFNEINRGNFFQWNQQCKFFSMKSASVNSALENFSNFSKKINVQTTDRSVQNFWGLGFGMFAILPISARQNHRLFWRKFSKKFSSKTSLFLLKAGSVILGMVFCNIQ